MRIGYRVASPDEVGLWEADLIQISVYRGPGNSLETAGRCARACLENSVPHVLHPVCYPLLDRRALEDIRRMAVHSGQALILHDETAPGGGRLSGRYEAEFRKAVVELGRLAPLSFENAMNTPDAPWFWERFAGSVTLDMGHMEAAGLDSVEFVKSLDGECISKVRYVHMHRNGGLRGGLTDHWPLMSGCRELMALAELLKRKRDVGVILEINETGEIGESLDILKALRDGLSG